LVAILAFSAAPITSQIACPIGRRASGSADTLSKHPEDERRQLPPRSEQGPTRQGEPTPTSQVFGPEGSKHPGNRQLRDKRGSPDAAARLCGNLANPKVATFCAALWPTFTLPLTGMHVFRSAPPAKMVDATGHGGCRSTRSGGARNRLIAATMARTIGPVLFFTGLSAAPFDNVGGGPQSRSHSLHRSGRAQTSRRSSPRCCGGLFRLK
jgi:hypothetical protein